MPYYDTTLFEAAHERLLTDVKTLTDDDIAQFAAVDPTLADRARAKRSGFVEQETDEERQLLARPATHRELIDFLRDGIGPILATHRYRGKTNHDLIVALEQRITAAERSYADAEERIVELEATIATTAATR
jgi:hypothetical protein